MKPAILVALLFRTLDAFRIFDTIFVLTASTQNRAIETVSNLGYNSLLTQLNLGVGSAVSVLIFLWSALIAFVFIKLLGTDVRRGRRHEPSASVGWATPTPSSSLRAVPRAVDPVAVAQEARRTSPTGG